MTELGLADTNGILAQPWLRPARTTSGLGLAEVYLSAQHERPYRAEFAPARSHQLILHTSGPAGVRRGTGAPRRVPVGGLFLQPAHRPLAVELCDPLDTVHVYLTDTAVPGPLTERLGVRDALLEHLVLALDGVVRDWQPSARAYAEQLGLMIAAQLAHRHGLAPVAEPVRRGLCDERFGKVHEFVVEHLAEPLSLTDLARVAGLSVSQFARQFTARTGLAPHRWLLRERLDRASVLLRATDTPIAAIAAACGFSHQEHLTRVMRSHLDTTPAALRRAG
ncbi:AraC family transcriptional regulator [Crossiella equi]|uniref:AraC family transcriptional regulator n=1 Tax=Crossiella equi TaxID=130796 RepID=A0ABS5AR43_9PSEU|nr:AraC family transcriptional regulator [Crossiella equi]MBP2479015.1 AraC family transcriptional regulator [Crossiella equi]